MSVLQFSMRAVLCAAVWTSLHLCGFAQTIALPPWMPIQVDVCGTVISDVDCVQVLQTDQGGLFSVDDWTDDTTGIVAQVGDEIRVIGENPFGLCWNGCQPGVACLFNVDVSISCVREIQPICFGDGAPLACPCGNLSPQGADAGCLNSSGSGATLRGLGSNGVAADDLVLFAGDLPVGAPGMLVSGQTEVATAFKDGILCAGSPTTRIEVLIADASGFANTSAALAAAENLVPGDQRVYQLWYRDPQVGPCGTGSNISNAVRVSWL